MEMVVVNNCSRDGTWEYLQGIAEPRLRCLRNESNVGLFGNFNRCAAQATGEYTLFLCSDDRLEADFLAHAVALMDAEPTAALLTSRARLIDSRGRDRGITADHFPCGRYAGQSVPAAWFWRADLTDFLYQGHSLLHHLRLREHEGPRLQAAGAGGL